MSATARPIDATPAHGEFQMLALDLVDEAPWNPRKHFDKPALEELATSIRAHGVIEPILVRAKGGRFEAVFGARRLRASKLAGLDSVPAIVRALSDVEALEAAVIENLQRADVHPMEEAESYFQLLAQTERPLTVEDLAAKVGKSKAYVYGRLKLLALTPAARKAFYAGEMTASVALLVARIPTTLQKEALAVVTRSYGDGEPMGFRQAADIVQRRFMLNLKEASFDRSDAGLVPAAGACGACPKRTGANPDLFGDVGSADVCTDPVCYREKLDAWWSRQRDYARAAGRPVLGEKEAKEIFDSHSFGVHLSYKSPYVGLDTYHPSDPKGRTYGKLLGKRVAEAAVLAQAPSGEVVQLLPKKALPKLLKAAGHDFGAERAERLIGSTPEAREAAKKFKEKEEIADAVRERVVALLGGALDVQPLTREFWDAVADLLVEGEESDLEDVLARRVLGDFASFGRKRKNLTDDQLRGLCLEALVVRRLAGWSGAGMNHARLATWARIDTKAVEKQVKAARAAAPAKEPKKAKKGGRR